MINFPHLATRLFNVPLAITPDKCEIIMAALAERLGVTHLVRSNGQVLAFDQQDEGEAAGRDSSRPDRGYDLVSGVAVIPITGTLVQRTGTLRPYSGMTGYDGVRLAFLAALADSEVDAIVLDIDSPGGEVAGCFDLADTVYKARGRKPIWAVLDECAFSAAYAIASAADYITVPRTGGTGSVGVIFMHCDMSKALDKAGLTVTLITCGDRKADGADVAPLSKEAFARFQADVDSVGGIFVNTVARNRGMSSAAVRGTQATTFLGARGVEIGFADALMAPDEAFRALLKKLG
jgi:capsid assembly protease